MGDNYNYPLGADNEDAPWNQPEPKEATFKCEVSQTLTKHTTVTTTDYELDCEDDGEGNSGPYFPVPRNTDFEKAYKGCRFTPLELIEEFAKVLPDLIEKAKNENDRGLKQHYESLLDDCQGWKEDEFDGCLYD